MSYKSLVQPPDQSLEDNKGDNSNALSPATEDGYDIDPDDNDSSVTPPSDLFERVGSRVSTASNGESAPPKLSAAPQTKISLAVKPTKEMLIEYCKKIELTERDADAIIDQWLSNGFKTGKNPIKDWQACVRKYKTQGWLPSLNGRKKEMSIYNEKNNGTRNPLY